MTLIEPREEGAERSKIDRSTYFGIGSECKWLPVDVGDGGSLDKGADNRYLGRGDEVSWSGKNAHLGITPRQDDERVSEQGVVLPLLGVVGVGVGGKDWKELALAHFRHGVDMESCWTGRVSVGRCSSLSSPWLRKSSSTVFLLIDARSAP